MKKMHFRGYNWRYEKKYKGLRNILKPCYQFDALDKEYDEEAAKRTLIEFFCKFAKIKPSSELNFGLRSEYYSFFINMIPLQAALSSKNYSLACHELITLHGYEPILQKRIYNNLMLLYQKYLEE